MVEQKGFRVYTDVKRAEDDLVELFRDLPVCVISDVTHRIFSFDTAIRPYNGTKLLGTAITVKAPIGDNLMFHHAISLAKEGDVILVDAGGCVQRAICGENMMHIARKKGIRGFVIDGSFRDSEAAAELTDFAVYARGVMPNASYKALGPGEVNTPVSVGGAVVFPGDIIIGDADGLIAIRPEEAKRIAEMAKEAKEKEVQTLEGIENGTLDRSWIQMALEAKKCSISHNTWDHQK